MQVKFYVIAVSLLAGIAGINFFIDDNFLNPVSRDSSETQKVLLVDSEIKEPESDKHVARVSVDGEELAKFLLRVSSQLNQNSMLANSKKDGAHSTSQEGGRSNFSSERSMSYQIAKSPGDVLRADDEKSANDTSNDQNEDSNDNQEELVPDYCLYETRAAAVPGVFRCPCPGDQDWREDWRDFYNPQFVREQGC